MLLHETCQLCNSGCLSSHVIVRKRNNQKYTIYKCDNCSLFHKEEFDIKEEADENET